MARFILYDSTGDASVSGGTGSLVGLGTTPSSDYQTPTAAGVPNGGSTVIRISLGSQWEVCETVTSISAGIYTYSRGTLLDSSTGSRVNFGVGTANILFVGPSEMLLINVLTTAGDIGYHDGTRLQRLAIGGSHTVLHGGTTPGYSAVDLTADVTGTLPATNGGAQNLDVAIVSGAHYLALHMGIAGGAALTASQLYAYPFRVRRAITLVGLSVWTNSSAASSKVRVGIYTDSGGKPSARLCDSGDLSTPTANTVVQGAVSLTLTPGVYWMAVQTYSTPSNLRMFAINGVGNDLAWSRVANASQNTGASVYQDANAYAALADPYPFGSPTLTSLVATNTGIAVVTLDT